MFFEQLPIQSTYSPAGVYNTQNKMLTEQAGQQYVPSKDKGIWKKGGVGSGEEKWRNKGHVKRQRKQGGSHERQYGDNIAVCVQF